MNAAYLDASALVKLFKPEPETAALRGELGRHPVRISSELVVVEAMCVARRLGATTEITRARSLLEGIDLLPFDEAIRDRAAAGFTRPLRALDAIHLASALVVSDEIGPFLCYDEALAHAARDAGLTVSAPT